MQVPCQDPLVDRLALSVLAAATAVAASAVTSATKTPASMPQSCAVVLSVPLQPAAAHTLDIVVKGRNLTTEAFTTVATFAQVTNASFATQRANLAVCYKMYQVIATAAGAFGSSEKLPYVVVLAGTDVMNAPIVQS